MTGESPRQTFIIKFPGQHQTVDLLVEEHLPAAVGDDVAAEALADDAALLVPGGRGHEEGERHAGKEIVEMQISWPGLTYWKQVGHTVVGGRFARDSVPQASC